MDIAEEIRSHVGGFALEPGWKTVRLLTRAADEIERLRKENVRLTQGWNPAIATRVAQLRSERVDYCGGDCDE